VRYPGWVHVDVASHKVTSRGLPSSRARNLGVGLHPHRGARERIERLTHLLQPVQEQGGCALVVCNTVRDAQDTFATLSQAFSTDGRPELLLLHARFPRWQRAVITRRVERLFGKDGSNRPHAAVLVATQVVEQSLDLDFDLVVSDLTPIALLLQRAGRGHRHERPRPTSFLQPRLEVLIPLGAAGLTEVPRSWRSIYDSDLLLRTSQLLAERAERPIRVPDDIQALVDHVYAGFADERGDDALFQLTLERLARESAQEGLANVTAIPRPDDVDDLHQLSPGSVDEDLITTRLGADSVLVLCPFDRGDGRQFLDAECTQPLPLMGDGPAGRFTRAQVISVLAHTVPMVRGRWMDDCGPSNTAPGTWQGEHALAGIVLLPHRLEGDVRTGPTLGTTSFLLDPRLGLRRDIEASPPRAAAERNRR
jgi:CRISPR-associated endonuclease/helicase Cas3